VTGSFAQRLARLRDVALDPRWWAFYFQRLFVRRMLREQCAKQLARFRPAHAFESPGGAPPAASALATVGLVHLGRVLSVEECGRIQSYLRDRPVRDPYRSWHGAYLPESAARHPHSHIAHHAPSDVVCAPHLLALANRRDILDLAASVLGCKPTISYLAAWWSYPTDRGAQHAEFFHRDVDDWRFLKLFVYLTPVGRDNGPHVYVRGSAASDKMRAIRRYEDLEVERTFGKGSTVALTGAAGEAFMEDTSGLHKGQPVVGSPRLIFQAVYSMFAMPYGPRRPLGDVGVLGQGGFDPWINRVYIPGRRKSGKIGET